MAADRLFVTTRSFQGGATFESFDLLKFRKGVVEPIRKLLTTAPPEFCGLAVVTCTEQGSKYAEKEVRDGLPPTHFYIREHFESEVASDKILLVSCDTWGLNPGSATALNAGIKKASEVGAQKVMMWSPEIDLSGHMVSAMLDHMKRHNLLQCGYFRNRWWQRVQWMVAQNTCVIWDHELLEQVGGMNPVCNGDGVTTIKTIEYGDVPLAGMEDIEAYFRACKARGEFIRWGCVGQIHPAFWNLALKEPGTLEYENNLKKIARQGMVMDVYAQQYFPDMEPADVYEAMMKVASFA